MLPGTANYLKVGGNKQVSVVYYENLLDLAPGEY